jgi:uncharacterized protein YneF (UPF0154 family)
MLDWWWLLIVIPVAIIIGVAIGLMWITRNIMGNF